MSATFKRYKAKFRYALRPFFVMINNKRKAMRDDEWGAYVLHIKHQVMNNPIEFLGDDLPSESLTADIVDDVFLEFMRERSYRDSSAQKAS